VDRAGIVTSLVLAPATGAPVPVPASAWFATLDLMHDREAFHETLIDAWRQAPGVHVTEAQAARMAWFAADEAAGEHDADDAEGLQRFADFCRRSGGFTVIAEEAAAVAGPVTAPPMMPEPVPAWHGRARKALGPFAIVVIMAAKWALKLKALIFLLPKIKFLGTAFSALVSIGLYALFWGWPFAALFVLLLFVHELGHVIQLRREGISATAPMFIPFMGAVVGMRGLPKNVYVEAKVGLAGPILGGLGCVAMAIVAQEQHSQMLRAVAYTGFFLNLFNLAPITPLDGGRAAAALHPYVWFAGLGGLAFLFFRFPNAILLLILVLGGLDAYRRIRELHDKRPETLAYYRVTKLQRLTIAIVYFGLAAALVAGMEWSAVPRP
jgi:Zn-dependent protease